MAARDMHDIEIRKGATFVLDVDWKDEAGALHDLTGYSAAMQVRADYDADTAVLDLSSGDGDIVLAATAPNVKVEATPAATRAIPVAAGGSAPWRQTYVYDLEITDPSGRVTRLLQGRAVVVEEVTR